MPTELTPFIFEGHEVRVIERETGPWFVLADACKVLNLSNPSATAAALDEDEKAKFNLGSGDAATIVSEGGLYTVILRNRAATKTGSLPHRFRRWVTGEVLPTIRKTGGYNAAPMTREEQIAHALIASQQIVTEQRAKIERLEPKALAHDRIADADGTLCITDAAKSLQVQRKDLFSYMRGHRWIYSRPGTSDIAHQDKINSGLLAHKVTAVQRPDGTEKIATQVRVTPKGLTRLAAALNQPSAI